MCHVSYTREKHNDIIKSPNLLMFLNVEIQIAKEKKKKKY